MQFVSIFEKYCLKCWYHTCKFCKETALKEEKRWESQFLSDYELSSCYIEALGPLTTIAGTRYRILTISLEIYFKTWLLP